MLLAFAITLIAGFLPTFLILLDIFTYQMLYFTYSFLQSNSTRTDRLDFYNLKVYLILLFILVFIQYFPHSYHFVL